MTHEREHQLMAISEAISQDLHGARLSNQEVIDVIAIVLCAEVEKARQECGDTGTQAVFERFLRDCSRMIPGVQIQYAPAASRNEARDPDHDCPGTQRRRIRSALLPLQRWHDLVSALPG